MTFTPSKGPGHSGGPAKSAIANCASASKRANRSMRSSASFLTTTTYFQQALQYDDQQALQYDEEHSQLKLYRTISFKRVVLDDVKFNAAFQDSNKAIAPVEF
jgi:hypothetical protein